MSFAAQAGESAEELNRRVEAALTRGSMPEEMPLFTYEEYRQAPPDLSRGAALIMAVASQSTPAVQMEPDAPFAVQGVEAGSLPDMMDMLPTIPLPAVVIPPCTWVPIFPTLDEISPENPEFEPTVEAVLRAFTDHQANVMTTSCKGLEETERKMKQYVERRTPGYHPPNLLRRKGMGEGAFSAKHIVLCTVADHRDVPDADKRPLVMFLGFAVNEKEAEELVAEYGKNGVFKHTVTGVPARTWFAPQLLYMRRIRPSDKFVSESKVMQGVVEDQMGLFVRGEDGRTLLERLKDGDGEGSREADGGEAAEPAEDAGEDAGASAAAEAEEGGEGGGAGSSPGVAGGPETE
jgi:hypothetical protein